MVSNNLILHYMHQILLYYIFIKIQIIIFNFLFLKIILLKLEILDFHLFHHLHINEVVSFFIMV